ncbi:RHS repeat-associated core domain-containing protein [Nonomuraea sp. CA-141351]|uniref:RHS repeat-associated core domain-containing protein n=1 Tax=Nonomuraea sp. CA-141351 TaxID=3239996 RepID=UPI003D948F26
MRLLRRGVAMALPAVLAATLLWPQPATAEIGPSVPLPDAKTTPVEKQTTDARKEDDATRNALHGDQPAGGRTDDGGGNTRATPLSPSATWKVSEQTGDFSWSYPLRVPPAPGGLEPELSLSYLSSAVDGRTSATNNQASWVGDGWDMSPGFVERVYLPCVEDDMGDAKPDTGDLCWRSENATAVYNGSGGMLIRDDGDDANWRVKDDDGSRVEHLFGAGNGDDNGEYWKITTVDGTQYFFGSRPEGKSTWTVPVFGDDDKEPCHQDTFAASHCVQGWRWNLDKVVDRNGNQIVYNYVPETNSYGMNKKDTAVSYIRGGTLQNIQYGFRDGQQPSGEVWFDTADRCVPGSTCTPDRKENWPDVPWEQNCAAATCHEYYAPTFWSTKRLAKITTRVRRDGGFADVDSWELNQEFPNPGDGEKATLWLKGIKHTGLAGGSLDLPEVTFEGTKMPNRVYTAGDGYAPLNRYRVTGVVSESGGVLSVVYEQPDCVGGTSVPAEAKTNTMRCFPAWWNKKDYVERLDYFQKYVVKQVTQSDRMGTFGEQVTSYEYLDGAGWHYDTSEFVKDSKKTWNDFRGFRRVVVRSGQLPSESGPITKKELRFYRGMNGDKDRAPVTVQATVGDPRADEDWLRGQPLESIVYDGDTDTVLGKTITDPIWQGPTATRGAYKAYIVSQGATRSMTALSGGAWRTTRVAYKYDDRGQPIEVDDQGDTTTAEDDRCTRTTYHRNTGAWLLSFPARVETVGVACAATPAYPQDVISDVRTAYDGQGFDTPPTTGNATKAQEAKDHPADGDPVYVTTSTREYDVHGRVTKSADTLGRTTTTTYTPGTGGPVTQTAVTNPLGHMITTTLDPAWGQETLVKDANDRKTETKYDALGRTVAVWLANRPRSDYPNDPSNKFAYKIDKSGINVVTTTSVGPKGNYTTSKEIYDGLLRPRQKQVPATGGGRLLTDTRYDSQGRAYLTTQPYFQDADVDDNLWVASRTAIPGYTVTTYDGAGRKSVETVHAGNRTWKTTTAYGGDRISVTPPSGGTATTVVNDARGRTTELRQYHGGTPDGDYDRTVYTHTDAGRLASVTDPAGNVWRYTYDLRGRQTKVEDPDTGTTTMGYDDAGQLTTTTTGRGTLTYAYDDLGRKTEEKQGATVLASWTYDTADAGKGKIASSTRYVGGAAYKRTVRGYSALYDELRSTLVIPEAEQTLAGTYITEYKYNWDGTPQSVSLPPVGGLNREDVTWTYDDLAHPLELKGSLDNSTVVYAATSQYSKYGELERLELGVTGKRVWQSYYYEDGTRRLNRTIVDAEVARPMQADVNYTYDDAGNITSIADTPRDLPADTQCFRYDYLQRLAEAWTPGTGCSTAPAVSALAGPAPYWQSFTYDKAGNRDTETQHTATGNTVRDYTSTAHRLDSITTGATTAVYQYNTAGDMVTKPGQRLDWDVEGHLAKVTEGGKESTFVYDADGERLIRRDSTGTTLYLDDQELRLDKATNKLVPTRYYQLGARTVAMRTTAGVTWLAGDHQGTSQFAIDNVSQKVTQRRQTPFGGSRGAAVAFPGEKGFVGGTVDASTGLTHLGAREYDPSTGRFVSADPVMDLTDPQQMNAYGYSNNNPVTYADPTGEFLGLEKLGDAWNKVSNYVTSRASQAATAVGHAAATIGHGIVYGVQHPGEALSWVARHGAPILGTAALILGAASPVGLVLGAVAIGLGAINAYNNCGQGKKMDCAMDLVGMIPVAGKVAVGVARGFRYGVEATALAQQGRYGGAFAALNDMKAAGGNGNPWPLINTEMGKVANVTEAGLATAGDMYYVNCDIAGPCPGLNGPAAPSFEALPQQDVVNLKPMVGPVIGPRPYILPSNGKKYYNTPYGYVEGNTGYQMAGGNPGPAPAPAPAPQQPMRDCTRTVPRCV